MSRLKFKKLLQAHPVLFQSQTFTDELTDRLKFFDQFCHLRFEYIEADQAAVLNAFNVKNTVGNHSWKSMLQMVFKPKSQNVVVTIFAKQITQQTTFSLKYNQETLKKALTTVFDIWYNADSIVAHQSLIEENLQYMGTIFLDN